MLNALNKEIRFGTDLHTKLMNALSQRKKLSVDKMKDRHEAWTKSEEVTKAYIKTSENDRLREEARDNGSPQYVTLEIPYSYGLLMAAHTYWTNVFLSRSPILQYQARHGAGFTGEQAVESIMDYQAHVGGMMVPWTYWLFDTPKYGVGWVGHYWDNETVRVSNIVEEEVSFAGFAMSGKTRKVKRTVEVPGYQGNRVYNIRPQDAWPDPRVSIANFQQGEFFARYVELSWTDLHEGWLDKRYINIDVLKKMGDLRANDPDRDYGDTEWDLPNDQMSLNTDNLGIPGTGIVKCYEMYVRLIPKLWNLGKGERSELWVFLVADNHVLIQARPLGELHNKFPIDVMEYEVDAHNLFKRSMLETVQPLNDALTWLINSHFFGVRKALNNQFVYDPSRIRGSDITDPEHGLLIRMKPNAYGQPIGNLIQQMKTTDVTQNHINDSKVIMEYMQRISGVNDMILGMMNKSGRQTATEVRGASGFSMSRLKTQAEFMSAMGFGPHSQRLLQTTQQHLSIERKYKLAGDLLPGGPEEMMVNPEAIAGFYDFIPVDGSMPVDRFAQANLWKELLMQLNAVPQIAQQYDFAKMFAYTAQLAGAKNIQRFKVNLVPDQQLLRQQQAGNVIPLGGQDGGARTGGNAGDDAGTIARINEPRQIAGVGPVS
jgi:hypothetical protein